jgi:hypothetical protein
MLFGHSWLRCLLAFRTQARSDVNPVTDPSQKDPLRTEPPLATATSADGVPSKSMLHTAAVAEDRPVTQMNMDERLADDRRFHFQHLPIWVACCIPPWATVVASDRLATTLAATFGGCGTRLAVPPKAPNGPASLPSSTVRLVSLVAQPSQWDSTAPTLNV